MKLINKQITTILLAGFAVLAMTGCGSEGTPSNTGIIPGVEEPINPPDSNETKQDMTTAQAKDAMALNAFIYPVVSEVTNLFDCLQSGDNLSACLKDSVPNSLEATTTGTQELQPGTYECTTVYPDDGKDYGTFTYAKDGDTIRFTFSDNCEDYGNKKKLSQMMPQFCLSGKVEGIDLSPVETIGTYKVKYGGSLECSPGKYVANKYFYQTSGNSQDPKMQWTYDGGLEIGNSKIASITDTLSVNYIAKYGDSTTAWDDLFMGSDETWKFENSASVTLGSALVFNGKASYIKGDNDWKPTDPEKGTGFTTYVDTSALTYDMIHTGRDVMAKVSGTISATCQPIPVTYATTEDMEDLNSLRDAEKKRMPSSGNMTMTLPGYNAAPADFSSTGDSAQVMITSGEGMKTYSSWREILENSSCSALQEIKDTIFPPKPPIEDTGIIEIQEGCSASETTVIDASNPLELAIGEEQCINAWFVPTDGGAKERITTTVIWTSQDRSVATMDIFQRNSKVTGVSVGSTTVSATEDGITGSAPVVVSAH